MAIYTMSDIHGRYSEFQKMLDKIGLTGSDKLYILGDIVDRGPNSAEMLMWAIDEAPSNVHFLLGNHEDMMLEVVEHNPSWLQQRRNKTLWTSNGGAATARKLKMATTSEWRRMSLLPWLKSLPAFAMEKVASRCFLLVHAGVSVPAMRASETGSNYAHLNVRKESNLLELLTPAPDIEVYDIGHDLGKQSRDELIWSREEWLYEADAMPMHVVHGHTELEAVDIAKMEMASGHSIRWSRGRICHYFGNRHDIDCGAAIGKPPYALGCLRLDDMEEFYIPFNRTGYPV